MFYTLSDEQDNTMRELTEIETIRVSGGESLWELAIRYGGEALIGSTGASAPLTSPTSSTSSSPTAQTSS